MKASKILFLLAGQDLPSSKQRVLAHLERLKGKVSWQWDIVYLPNSPFRRMLLLATARHYQGIFVQKKILHGWEIALLRRLNERLIFDFDDAIMYPQYDPARPATGSSDRKGTSRYRNFSRLVRNSRAVIAGNPFLQKEAQKFNQQVYLLPTPIDTDSYRPVHPSREQGDRIIVGWYGSPGNIGYLLLLADVWREISERYPRVWLKIISQRFPPMPAVRTLTTYWREEEEMAELGSFDIGVMPLGDDPWSQGKCGYKLLKYMALGIPTISTATEATRYLIRDGREGYLVEEPGEWLERLARLIEDQGLRREMGGAARRRVEQSFSYHILNPKFQEIVESVYLSP